MLYKIMTETCDDVVAIPLGMTVCLQVACGGLGVFKTKERTYHLEIFAHELWAVVSM